MYNLCLHSLTSPLLKTIDKCQRYDHFIARGSDFKNDYYKKAYWLESSNMQDRVTQDKMACIEFYYRQL